MYANRDIKANYATRKLDLVLQIHVKVEEIVRRKIISRFFVNAMLGGKVMIFGGEFFLIWRIFTFYGVLCRRKM